MFFSAVAISMALIAPQDTKALVSDAKPVALSRVFPMGEKLQYAITSNLHIEARQYGLQTFLPDDLDLNYKFSTEVRSLKNDGVAVLHYLRPNLIQIQGATAERPSKMTVE